MNSTPIAERFWAKVKKTKACWNWTAAKNAEGYGRFLLNGKNRHAHRVSLELSGIKLKPGFEVDHLCRNRKCVKPKHLEQVTHAENMSRNNALKTHCVNGHAFSKSNTYDYGFRRICKACTFARVKAKRIKHEITN